MCIAICYKDANRIQITTFAQVDAKLPVQKKSQGIEKIIWGRRSHEKSKFPFGGWATLSSIQTGEWDRYFPKAVKIPAIKFMEQNVEGQACWFDVTDGQWIQGLLVQEQTEQRVYIVTLSPQWPESTYCRWPRILW